MININLENKTILVTGATGQLGREMVRILAKAGANIIIHYHSNEKMALLLKEELLKNNVKVYIVKADIKSLDSVMEMKKELETNFLLPDIIVNNAVSQYHWTNILNQDNKDFIDQFESCVLQNVNMAKAFIPHMIANKCGKVIAINTECAMQCFENQGAYASAKRGMDGLLRVLAKEVGPYNITVNQIAPGWTISDNDRLNHSEVQPESDKKIPLRRRGTDIEVANAVLFLASSLADYITGVYIPVSGGTVMPTI